MTPLYTRVLPPSEETLRQAAEYIRSGELVAFPTETVYGLGANALDGNAVLRIFEAKGRPGDNPLIAHIATIDQLDDLIFAEPSPAAKAMMEAFWPGPLTMIFPKSAYVPSEVTAGLDTIAIRMPSHPVARRLIELAGVPIAAPSANRSGRPSPTAAQHVLEDMDGRVPLIIDGGACAVGLESTVADMTGEVPRVLRPGGVTAEQIAAVAGSCAVDDSVMRPLKAGEKPRSPGMKYRHYAPKGELTLFGGSAPRVCCAICERYDAALAQGARPLILAMEANIPAYGKRRVVSLGDGEEEMARRIFALLRDADALNADVLFSEAVEASGLGLAIMNRLGRAAAFHIVNVDEGGDEA
ncbi:MAG: threonylcarbamoyl-AMP synthase [Clostridia bacterium]|nr:threonylcarbamoyl-AMP synthase [Clostridia bacterium]